MGQAAQARKLGPYELPDSLFYATPPPEWWTRESHPAPDPRPGTRLLTRLREAIRVRRYSRRTEEAYVQWVKRYVFFHGVRHPRNMGKREIENFLSDLAMRGKVGPSTQNQALCALVFLYRHVLDVEIGFLDELARAKRPRRRPVVLTPDEVARVFAQLDDPVRLVCQLLYGSGLRLLECLELRIKDLGLDRREITVRRGKGGVDRITLLPAACLPALTAQLERVRRAHQHDLAQGRGRAPLPAEIGRRYPTAATEWEWQYVFPASTHYTDAVTGTRHRHHLHESVVQKRMGEAVRRAGVGRPATPHSLRHSFATELVRGGYDIRTVQELLGHKDVNTTMIYTHVLNRRGPRILSPADTLHLSAPRGTTPELGRPTGRPNTKSPETDPAPDP